MNQPPNFQGDEKAHRIAYLIAGYIRQTLTEREHDELDEWVEASDENMRLFEDLTDENHIEANLRWMDEVNTKRKLNEVKKGLVFKKDKSTRQIPTFIAIAASVLVIVVAVYLIQDRSGTNENSSASINITEILPAENKVVLRTADGKTIDLTAAEKGAINTNDGSVANNDNNVLRYETSGAAAIHSLSTGKGGKYQLTLSDGTKVWMNASSTLTYPSAFTGNDRTVQLSGEAYFEVVKDASKPFSVKLSDNEKVTVLGTHFNLQNYADEQERSVTLLEGKVKVFTEHKDITLSPSQQAAFRNGDLKLSGKVDIEEVMGWKDDLFVFHDADIKTILRQLARWYDIEVVYQSEVPQLFNASISRGEPLSKLLKLLELTGKIHFKTENKKVYVLQ